MGRQKHFLSRAVLCIFLSFLALVSFPTASFALTATQRLIYGQNNLVFYNPDEALCQPTYSGGDDSGAPSGGGYDRLKWVVQEYGQYAMEMQREFGTPWEVVLAQMQKESSVGTAGIAVNGATNNWLGITGEGDAGSITLNRKWAVFSSLRGSIEAWAGWRVLRNGYYDKAFVFLDPSNYNLPSFLSTMIHTYAPSSDGNDEEQYVKDVLSFINGPIAEKRAELGWPSSIELAINENIPIGGRHAIGSSAEEAASSQAAPTAEICNSNGQLISGENGAAIASLALLVAWPDNDHHNEVKPEFAEYAQKVGSPTSLSFAQDCGHFVSVVIRNTVDPGFPEGGTKNMESYMDSSDSWTKIENLNNTSNLQPGDVLVVNRGSGGGGDGHIMIYTGDVNGYNLASASYSTTGNARTGNVGSVYFSDSRGTYSIFRFTGTKSAQVNTNNILKVF